eukprot:4392977-Lingulodinium_polyedra.AAC.1
MAGPESCVQWLQRLRRHRPARSRDGRCGCREPAGSGQLEGGLLPPATEWSLARLEGPSRCPH